MTLPSDDLSTAWDARIAGLIRRLPDRMAAAVSWIREPSRRGLRIGTGLVLVLGGIFSILPVLGLWMLPLGLALLADDWPALKPRLERAALWLERTWRRVRPLRGA